MEIEDGQIYKIKNVHYKKFATAQSLVGRAPVISSPGQESDEVKVFIFPLRTGYALTISSGWPRSALTARGPLKRFMPNGTPLSARILTPPTMSNSRPVRTSGLSGPSRETAISTY
jgi:hypothetical protein